MFKKILLEIYTYILYIYVTYIVIKKICKKMHNSFFYMHASSNCNSAKKQKYATFVKSHLLLEFWKWPIGFLVHRLFHCRPWQWDCIQRKVATLGLEHDSCPQETGVFAYHHAFSSNLRDCADATTEPESKTNVKKLSSLLHCVNNSTEKTL